MIGGSRADTGGSSVIGSLSYSKQFATDTLTVSLNRSTSTNANDDEIIDTRLGIGYSHPINSVSRLSLSLD